MEPEETRYNEVKKLGNTRYFETIVTATDGGRSQSAPSSCSSLLEAADQVNIFFHFPFSLSLSLSRSSDDTNKMEEPETRWRITQNKIVRRTKKEGDGVKKKDTFVLG